MRIPAIAGAATAAAACTLLAGPVLAQAPAPKPASSELYRGELPDMPDKQMVVVKLTFPPGNAPKGPAHQHPGSVLVYVTKGEARLGVQGQAPQVVKAGQTFFEPVGAIHNVSESASPTEPAEGIAVMIVPDGAPLVTVMKADEHSGH